MTQPFLLYFISEKLVAALSFPELLSFITGAAEVPPMGFETKLYMQFFDQEPNQTVTRLPYTSTCTLTFSLPRGCCCEVLNTLLVRAVTESQGFHKM